MNKPNSAYAPKKASHKVGILVVPGFSMTSLAAILDPLNHANALVQHELFECQLISLTGNSIKTTFGLDIQCNITSRQYQDRICLQDKPDVIYLCCGRRIANSDHKQLNEFLRNIRRHSIPIIGLGAAIWALADTKYITTGKCAVHWQSMKSFYEETEDFEIENALFATNGLVTTSPGEMATFDLTVAYVDKICGPSVANQICCNLVSSNRRSADMLQITNADMLFCDNEIFKGAVALMQDNIEHPLKTGEISSILGVSDRQIQRIFANNGLDTPCKYYRNIRLEKARQLLEQTQLSYINVSMACGFGSPSTFSKQFKARFNKPPSRMRSVYPSKAS
jgi:transcriptional regulator GlxA family with amidase domain